MNATTGDFKSNCDIYISQVVNNTQSDMTSDVQNLKFSDNVESPDFRDEFIDYLNQCINVFDKYFLN